MRTKKLIPFTGEDANFERDGEQGIWIMAPVNDDLFSKCIIKVPLYFYVNENASRRCVVFASSNRDDDNLYSYPIKFDHGDIILHESAGEESTRDLIKDLTTIFFSTNAELDLEGVDHAGY